MSPRKYSSRQAVFVIKGEIWSIITSLRKSGRWNSHQQDSKVDVLLRKLETLKDSLDTGAKNAAIAKICTDANYFLVPFLDVIRSEDTSGLVTIHALSSIEKFISYGIVNETNGTTGAVEAITDAVIHAHFVSSDSASDELVLMKILQVLHHLFMSPLGSLLTNESVCELMQSCFRMCFIERANELLRKSAEASLTEMISLLFSRLHSFPVEMLSKRSQNRSAVLPSPALAPSILSTESNQEPSLQTPSRPPPPVPLSSATSAPEITTPGPAEEFPVLSAQDLTPTSNNIQSQSNDSVPSIQVQEPTPKSTSKTGTEVETGETAEDPAAEKEPLETLSTPTVHAHHHDPSHRHGHGHGHGHGHSHSNGHGSDSYEFKTKRGVTFTTTPNGSVDGTPTDSTSVTAKKWEESLNVDENDSAPADAEGKPPAPALAPLQNSTSTPTSNPPKTKITAPYGIPCVRELFRFLVSLVNPHDPGQNTEVMIHVGLKLLLVTIETGIESMARHPVIMSLIKNELCKNLLALLSYQPPPNSPLSSTSILLNVFRIFIIIFESMRHSLKFQLEIFFTRVAELITESGSGLPGGASSGAGSGGGGAGPGGRDKIKWTVEQREIALYYLVQLWKLPCLVTELYLNYDCDLYCSNVFEETTKLLSKNAFSLLQSLQQNSNNSSINTSTLQQATSSTHHLCLDGLVSILDGIETHCTLRIVNVNANSSISSVISDESNCSSVFYHDQDRDRELENLEDSQNQSQGQTDSSGTLTDLEDTPTKAQQHRRRGFVNTGCSASLEETTLPTHEELMAIRHKKKMIHTGSELFNTKASKGIEFLQTQGLLSSPLDAVEVAHFLRENPLLDKRAIGDYISTKKNIEILKGFVKSFDFSRSRVDQALRLFLETFRLPGESPLISIIMEEFAEHWTQANGNPFANTDSAYLLAYAVIMLNVDQHNNNVKKQGNSMTWEDFLKNLRGSNGGEDFNHEMLKDIYTAIKGEEIIMPAEQVGAVKENYMWKVLLKRGNSPSCKFLTPAGDVGVFDHDLFSLSWGPIVAALSFIFDKTADTNISSNNNSSNSGATTNLNSHPSTNGGADAVVISKTLMGFRKCATISAHYGMSDVFDNLIISLCKFTTLMSGNPPDLGGSKKAQAACQALFQHVHRHGDILREGWHNFIDCLVALFKLQILPKILTESEDFTEPSGRVSLVRRTIASAPRVETGLLSSLYFYIASSTADSTGSKSSVPDEAENRKRSETLILECRPELLLSESKFLQLDSLHELIKSLIYASPVPDRDSKRKDYDEDVIVFVLEMLLKISVQNRDRALAFWDVVREHLFAMILASASNDMPYLLERSTVGLMRVALRLMRKEDLCPIILQSLNILLYLRPAAVVHLSQQLSFGLHEILKTTAANIHTAEEWTIIFSLLEYVGAGKIPSALTASVLQTQQQQQSQQRFSGGIPNSLLREVSLGPSQSQGQNGGTGQGQGGVYPSLVHSISQDPLQGGGGGGSGPVGYSSGSDRGYTSDSELEIRSSNDSVRNSNVSPAQSWILLTQSEDQSQTNSSSVTIPPESPRRLASSSSMNFHQQQAPPPEHQRFYPDPKSLIKSCETLSFLVRDAAHITPDNFTLCVSAIRSFVEASTMKARGSRTDFAGQGQGTKMKKRVKKPNAGLGLVGSNQMGMTKSKSLSFAGAGSTNYDADESDPEDHIAVNHQVSVQLLDLLHTLHLRAAQIFQWWQKENKDAIRGVVSIWTLGWKPILQAIVILCSDARKPVRTTALNYLQGALLVHDLQQLSADEWFSCFNEVLFPLMGKLIEPLNPVDPAGMEETRMRAITLLSRVFLQHLTPLLQLESFTFLWLQILEFLNKYLHHSERSELLVEGIPESLKNMLLVMQTGGIFHTPDGYTRLWATTWEKIDSFLPNLRAELFRSVRVEQSQPQPQPQSQIQSQQQQQPQPPGEHPPQPPPGGTVEQEIQNQNSPTPPSTLQIAPPTSNPATPTLQSPARQLERGQSPLPGNPLLSMSSSAPVVPGLPVPVSPSLENKFPSSVPSPTILSPGSDQSSQVPIQLSSPAPVPVSTFTIEMEDTEHV